MPGEPLQRRRFPRYRAKLAVTLYLGSRIAQGSIVNISRGGCLIFPPLAEEPSAGIKISFSLNDGEPPINCKGEIVYTIQDRGTGVGFTEISVYNQDRITAHFEKLAAGGKTVAG